MTPFPGHSHSAYYSSSISHHTVARLFLGYYTSYCVYGFTLNRGRSECEFEPPFMFSIIFENLQRLKRFANSTGIHHAVQANTTKQRLDKAPVDD
ncbi:hypothetical protein PoB_004086500 [Plakobranchus ocellatus]|uniref:Uncharacterized protein n=1 Tax=Plakobranchus ocellatus TaxID=259542 RepID=A0AAV4B440_9GAST|nr:hypothetical protein PoB_004086500 [Plakobranchus ocellatus]